MAGGQEFRFVQYTPEHYETVKALFLKGAPEGGAPDHFYFTRELYEWLYKGFGHDRFTSLLLFRGDEFGTQRVVTPDTEMSVEKCQDLPGYLRSVKEKVVVAAMVDEPETPPFSCCRPDAYAH